MKKLTLSLLLFAVLKSNAQGNYSSQTEVDSTNIGYLTRIRIRQDSMQNRLTTIRKSNDSLVNEIRAVNVKLGQIKNLADSVNHCTMSALNYTTNLSLTYSVANAFMQGSAGANTFSIALGTGWYEIDEFTLLDIGGNNGGSRGMYMFNDTIKPVENFVITMTAARWYKFLGYYVANISNLTNVGIDYKITGTNTGGMRNIIGTKKIFTGNVYFYFTCVTGGSNLNGQIEVARVLLRRIR